MVLPLEGCKHHPPADVRAPFERTRGKRMIKKDYCTRQSYVSVLLRCTPMTLLMASYATKRMAFWGTTFRGEEGGGGREEG